jgi:uncharacterized membrane protein YdjX (TVP38/TMEM64 family)
MARQIHHHHKISKVVASLFLILGLLASVFYLARLFDIEEIKVLVENQGLWGQVIYIFFTATSVVIAPLTILPLWPVVLLIYGLGTAFYLTVLGSLLGGIANFYLARKFERGFVEKLLGKKAMHKVDEFVKQDGWQTLFILQLIGTWYDYVSYAAGLTRIAFQTFFLVTLITLVIRTGAIFFLMNEAIAVGRFGAVVVLIVSNVIGLLAGIEIWQRHRNHVK